MSETLDNQVILEFQKGNPDAFERVFKLFYPKLVDFAWRMIGSLDDAKDIAQVAFIKLFEISDKFDGANNIQAFLYTAIKNRSLNFLRDQKTQSNKLKEIGAGLQSYELLADEFEIKDALYSKVLAAIDRLPGECGRIFKMLFIDELSPAEVAEILDIAKSTVYNQKQNGLKLLRINLGENSLAIAWILSVLLLTEQKATLSQLY